MNHPFNVIAINGSHRSANGITEIILRKFLEGARSAGAVCDVIYPSKMTILPCKACHTCIVKTPGVCIQKDDMPDVLKKIEGADLLVMAAPVYFDTMPSDMKKMFERLLPTLGPVFEFRDGRSYHPPTSSKKQNAVSIFVCGNAERVGFISISRTFTRIINNMGGQIQGEFFFPSSSLLIEQPNLLKDQLDAITEAGKQAVTLKKIRSETISAVNREYVADPAADIERKNKMFQRMMKND